MRYLSLDWIDALAAAVTSSDEMRAVAQEYAIGVTQVVTGTPEGDVTYHLVVRDGTATFGPGPAEPEDVRMVQDWDTAVSVATKRLNEQEAFITGRIRLVGDPQKLQKCLPVFRALAAVFDDVHRRTEYA